MRITTSVFLFYVWMTASANLLIESGFADALGMPMQTASSGFYNATYEMGRIQSGGSGGGGPLSGARAVLRMMRTAGDFAEAFTRGLTAAPRFMLNIGVPPEFVVFIHAPLPFLMARFGLYMLTERSA